FDVDRHASAFDRVVGYDAGADAVLSYGDVQEGEARALVHGAIFTRGPKDLHNTAIFIGGSDSVRSERLLAEVEQTFFGPFRVSVLFDPNGSNTTAAAAVLKMVRAAGGDVRGRRAVVFAGTGPVGARAAGRLARLGAEAVATSRHAGRRPAAAAGARGRAARAARGMGGARGAAGGRGRERGAAARGRGRGVRRRRRGARRRPRLRRARHRPPQDEAAQGLHRAAVRAQRPDPRLR